MTMNLMVGEAYLLILKKGNDSTEIVAGVVTEYDPSNKYWPHVAVLDKALSGTLAGIDIKFNNREYKGQTVYILDERLLGVISINHEQLEEMWDSMLMRETVNATKFLRAAA